MDSPGAIHRAITFRPTLEQLAQGARAACLACGMIFRRIEDVDRSSCLPCDCTADAISGLTLHDCGAGR